MEMDKRQCDQLLYDTLTDLLPCKSIDKLSVKDIITHAGVSRATFYRHYSDKYHLLNSYYESILRKTLYRCKVDQTYKEASYSIYKVIKENANFFRNAFRSADDNCLKNYIFHMSMDLHLSILQKNDIDTCDWKVIKSVESFIYGNLELTVKWVMAGMKEPIEDMIEVFAMGIPHQFASYFLESEELC